MNICEIKKEECAGVIYNFARRLQECLRQNGGHLEHVFKWSQNLAKGPKLSVLNCYYISSQKMSTFLTYFSLVINGNQINEFPLF